MSHYVSLTFTLLHTLPLIFIPQTLSPSQNSDYVRLRLTLGFGVIVVEVLFPLCGGELTHISNKQIFVVAIAEPVWTEEMCVMC